MRVFVSGSFRSATREPELCPKFVEALGREIVKQGHVLLNGCRSELDATIARAANKWLTENGRNPKKQIISYFPPRSGTGAQLWLDRRLCSSRLGHETRRTEIS